ncbi:hypothetical protein [Marinicellulosiphila megalodicopiae]|uniref:hypothetical protein n=1 Tax=Marinicellulosiphila megalodicopiae TaxID=2724896 RepID=UPI003BAF7B41
MSVISLVPVLALADSVPQSKRWFALGGFNRALYSDIRYDFKNEDYDFTLSRIDADNAEVFKNNVSVGYFFDENYAVSMGVDQLRYVLANGQTVKISGDIANVDPAFNGSYKKDSVTLTDDFIMFDKSDAINYLFVDHSYYSEYREYTPLEDGNVTAHWLVGLSAGMMVPKTNAILFTQESFDGLYLAGAGVNVKVGANLFLGQHFFVQSEMKMGYANLWNVKMTEDELTDITQQFSFGQINLSVGGLL